MTRKELDAALRNNPSLGAVNAEAHLEVPDPKRKQHQVGSLESKPNPAARVLPRITIRILSRRVKLLDEENLWAGTKDLVDGLRYSGLLPDDSPAEVRREVEQEKVEHYRDEETVVEIIYPELAADNQQHQKQPELWQDERQQREHPTQQKRQTGSR